MDITGTWSRSITQIFTYSTLKFGTRIPRMVQVLRLVLKNQSCQRIYVSCKYNLKMVYLILIGFVFADDKNYVCLDGIF